MDVARHRLVPDRGRERMVLSLAAYVYASVRTDRHEFAGEFAFLLFLADSFTAAAIFPDVPF